VHINRRLGFSIAADRFNVILRLAILMGRMMRTWYFILAVGLFSIPGYADTPVSGIPTSKDSEGSVFKDSVFAKQPTIACYYHDVVWDRKGYGKDGSPTADFLALDTCEGIAFGQQLELYENQTYAPGGLKIVRIDDKLYFVQARHIAKKRPKPAEEKKSVPTEQVVAEVKIVLPSRAP